MVLLRTKLSCALQNKFTRKLAVKTNRRGTQTKMMHETDSQSTQQTKIYTASEEDTQHGQVRQTSLLNIYTHTLLSPSPQTTMMHETALHNLHSIRRRYTVWRSQTNISTKYMHIHTLVSIISNHNGCFTQRGTLFRNYSPDSGQQSSREQYHSTIIMTTSPG